MSTACRLGRLCTSKTDFVSGAIRENATSKCNLLAVNLRQLLLVPTRMDDLEVSRPAFRNRVWPTLDFMCGSGLKMKAQMSPTFIRHMFFGHTAVVTVWGRCGFGCVPSTWLCAPGRPLPWSLQQTLHVPRIVMLCDRVMLF